MPITTFRLQAWDWVKMAGNPWDTIEALQQQMSDQAAQLAKDGYNETEIKSANDALSAHWKLRNFVLEPRERCTNPMLSAVNGRIYISIEDANTIIEEVGLKRDFTPKELVHCLYEAARAFEYRNKRNVRWKQFLNYTEKFETAAENFRSMLTHPWADWFLPSSGQHNGLLSSAARENVERLRLASVIGKWQIIQDRHNANTRAIPHDADCVLMGGNLPLIFEVLYQKVKKGEIRGVFNSARTRFIIACCKVLRRHRGLTAANVKKQIERFNERSPENRIEILFWKQRSGQSIEIYQRRLREWRKKHPNAPLCQEEEIIKARKELADFVAKGGIKQNEGDVPIVTKGTLHRGGEAYGYPPGSKVWLPPELAADLIASKVAEPWSEP